MAVHGSLDTSEVHGCGPTCGYRVFIDAALRQDESAAAQVTAKRRKRSVSP